MTEEVTRKKRAPQALAPIHDDAYEVLKRVAKDRNVTNKDLISSIVLNALGDGPKLTKDEKMDTIIKLLTLVVKGQDILIKRTEALVP